MTKQPEKHKSLACVEHVTNADTCIFLDFGYSPKAAAELRKINYDRMGLDQAQREKAEAVIQKNIEKKARKRQLEKAPKKTYNIPVNLIDEARRYFSLA